MSLAVKKVGVVTAYFIITGYLFLISAVGGIAAAYFVLRMIGAGSHG